jgi:hypothetical protein
MFRCSRNANYKTDAGEVLKGLSRCEKEIVIETSNQNRVVSLSDALPLKCYKSGRPDCRKR